jgi:hypothetical protein
MKPLSSNQPLDFYLKSGILKTIGLLAIAASIFAIDGRSAAIASDLSDQASLTTEQIPSPIPNPELLADSSSSPIPNSQSPIPNHQFPITNYQSPIPHHQFPNFDPLAQSQHP